MRISLILSRYIARRFLSSIVLVFGVVVAVAFLIDVVNLGDRASSREEAGFGLVLEMALLRIPFLTQKVLPFAMLFGTMLTYIWLTRSNELVVTRAAGVSAWQFLLPSLAIALLLGAFVITVFNPLASAMVSRFEQLENQYLRGQSSLLAVSPSGLWLREGDGNRQFVIHANRVSASGADLGEVIIFAFEDDDRFVERIDAERALLRDGYWDLENVLVTRPDATAETFEALEVPTDLTVPRIQNSFASPETMSFWDLPGFINTMEEAGFSALRHKIHWHSILAIPLLLAAMVLVAATFSLRLTRRGRLGLFILAGLGSGFQLYFLSDISLALGMSGSLPPILSAWAPAAIFAMIGSALLFHMEDG
ncbi:MAG: LPS export ABC transporter permease LptG [Rhodospirillaceae bacterium]|jgi:lipopolysaccharide export system permease protein|nr:LPS export ABC transporter permease LptG [Rhodospirillaceae bacterium]MBT6205666.1 LPS export ABC transporter permease LptG [Rhodospirillaceae bacterium]MBT6509293.1 LPS export ABC transporter permease LptG [Rhodospirillaceae bacterium]MBT7613078.1 LPS export ABC transporter permease LptG [Rhodospirillaceae bacterium]MBT7648082.1 LPS export ABC transporter permease LptG [Rhodospirillaceae bacterium]